MKGSCLLRSALYLISVLIVVLFTSLVAIAILVFVVWEEKDEFKEMFGSHPHQYYLYDPKTETFSKGYTSLNKQLEKNDYVSYTNGFGQQTLITNFESLTHKCTGYCYCEEENKRRIATSQPLVKGMTYLVAAASSLLAASLAKDHFEKECVKEFQDACVFSEIEGDVGDCVTFDEEGEIDQIDYDKYYKDFSHDEHARYEDDVEISEELLEDRRGRVFDCFGSCVKTGKHDNFDIIMETIGLPKHLFSKQDRLELQRYEESIEEFKCREIKLTKKVYWKDLEKKDLEYQVDERRPNEAYTEKVFMQLHLNPYCVEESHMMIDFKDEDIEIGFSLYFGEEWRKFPRCAGWRYHVNPSVYCVQEGHERADGVVEDDDGMDDEDRKMKKELEEDVWDEESEGEYVQLD